MTRRLRIAQVAPPLEPVPPRGYGGTERVIAALVGELVERGHEVTTFASGDSSVPGRLIPTVQRALRPDGFRGDPAPYVYTTIRAVLDRATDFDLIHSHLEWASPILAMASPVPVVTTFHGRLDVPWAEDLLAGTPGLVAISQSQASAHPGVGWAGVVHNGLPLTGVPFERRRGDHLVFVGRLAPEKGILDAIEVARASGRPIKIIAKRPALRSELEYHDQVYAPAVRAAGGLVEDLSELAGAERDRVVAGSHALLMPGTWPEPFGLTAIEALACGTPVLARRVGAIPEIVREGIDGFFGDDVGHLTFLTRRIDELDRVTIRASVLERFSAGRMADGYEAVYRRSLAHAAIEHAASARIVLDPIHAAPLAVGPGRGPSPDDPVIDPGAPLPPLRAIADAVAEREVAASRD